jgi:hypothetical protein
VQLDISIFIQKTSFWGFGPAGEPIAAQLEAEPELSQGKKVFKTCRISSP